MRSVHAANKAEAAAQDLGQAIYAYCHVQTKQVLYSTTRQLNPRVLEQLPDAGANNNPPSIRKDHWKPLYTLISPHPYQGLDAFKRLREYKRLHETNWIPPEKMHKPYTEEEMEKLEKRLDERGGSKKESVYDLIKREKKKMRARMVMNQKANSIADLAAVLQEQEEVGRDRTYWQKKERRQDRRAEVEEMLRLATEAEDGGELKLQEQIDDLQALLDSESMEGRMSRRKATKQVAEWTREKEKMTFASEAVTVAKQAIENGMDAENDLAKRVEKEAAIAELEQEGTTVEAFRQTVLNAEAEARMVRDHLRHRQEEFSIDAVIKHIDRLAERMRRRDDEFSHCSEADAKPRANFLAKKREVLSELQPRIQQGRAELAATGPAQEEVHFKAKEIMEWDVSAVTQLRDQVKEENWGKQFAFGLGRMEEIFKQLPGAVELETLAQETRLAADEALRLAVKMELDFEFEVQQGLVSAEQVQPEPEPELAQEVEPAADRETKTGEEATASSAEQQSPQAQDQPTSADAAATDEQIPGEKKKKNKKKPRKPRKPHSTENYSLLLPPLPPHLSSLPTDPLEISALKKGNPLKDKIRRLTAPIYTMRGTTVKWNDILDAEFAESWPSEVVHERMGFNKHLAPQLTSFPKLVLEEHRVLSAGERGLPVRRVDKGRVREVRMKILGEMKEDEERRLMELRRKRMKARKERRAVRTGSANGGEVLVE